jgi:pimeloyl-ACP methyl ester carboxylesterase
MEISEKRHTTKVNGTFIAWSEIGSGPSLIFIHGFQDTRRVWNKVAPLLADDFRVIMLDLPGSGLSGRPDASYTLSWYSRMIINWMDECSIEHAHFCGHSFGGGIAQWMMLEDRSRINRLALIAPGGLGREVGMWLKPATFPVLGRQFTPLVIRYIIPALMRVKPELFGNRDSKEINLLEKTKRIPGTDMAFQRSLEAVINPFGQYMQTRQRVQEVDRLPPIELFWGENDPILPIKHARSILAKSTGITLTIYTKCGHFPHLVVSDALAHDLKKFFLDQYRSPASFCFKTKKYADILKLLKTKIVMFIHNTILTVVKNIRRDKEKI